MSNAVSRAKRTTELRTAARECEAAGFSVFAAVNLEEALLLDPPQRESRGGVRSRGAE